jgi:two-component system nitrogen regulation response regulator GlnG
VSHPKDKIQTVKPVESGPSWGQGIAPCLTIAYHPDTPRIGERMFLFTPKGEPQPLSRLEPVFGRVDGTQTAPLNIVVVSRKPTWLSPAGDGDVLVSPDPDGSALTVDGEPLFAPKKIPASAVVAGVVLELAHRVVLVLHLAQLDSPRASPLGLLGESDALDTVRAAACRFAEMNAPVLVRGETGVGKELVAKAIHECSGRHEGPWVSVNLGAIPPSTAASALFGHVKGAFTGADRDHRGYFEQADGGTLFLDEVGAASPELQSMLLRALETGELQPVGGREHRRVDVRVVAATDEELEEAISAGRFRAPLFHRLAGLVVRIPPLRARKEDIGRLLSHFLHRELEAVDRLDRLEPPSGGKPLWLPAGLVSRLVRHPWPGNVRQLKNVIRQLVAANLDAEVVDEAHLPTEFLAPAPAPAEGALDGGAGPSTPMASEIDDHDLVAAMRANRWRINATALALGISRNTLYSLIEKSPRLRKAKDIPGDEIRRCHAECKGDLGAMMEILEVSKRALQLRLKELELD